MMILMKESIVFLIFCALSMARDIFTCTLTSCHNGGSCLEGRCVCAEGFYGTSCEDQCDGPDSCTNHGACLGIPRKCECDTGYSMTGYYGKHCEDSCDPVVNGSCRYAGTCSGIPKKCNCKPGFHGDWCAACTLDIHCKNGGVCGNDGTCQCKKMVPEVRGVHCDEVCTKDVDCMNGGKCLPNKTCKCTKNDDGFRCMSSAASKPLLTMVELTFVLNVVIALT